MGIIKDFSENQKNYLRYQSRLEAEFERNTLYAELEKARKEKEENRKEKEAALKEAERLLLLLKKAGIDPGQS